MRLIDICEELVRNGIADEMLRLNEETADDGYERGFKIYRDAISGKLVAAESCIGHKCSIPSARMPSLPVWEDYRFLGTFHTHPKSDKAGWSRRDRRWAYQSNQTVECIGAGAPRRKILPLEDKAKPYDLAKHLYMIYPGIDVYNFKKEDFSFEIPVPEVITENWDAKFLRGKHSRWDKFYPDYPRGKKVLDIHERHMEVMESKGYERYRQWNIEHPREVKPFQEFIPKEEIRYIIDVTVDPWRTTEAFNEYLISTGKLLTAEGLIVSPHGNHVRCYVWDRKDPEYMRLRWKDLPQADYKQKTGVHRKLHNWLKKNAESCWIQKIDEEIQTAIGEPLD